MEEGEVALVATESAIGRSPAAPKQEDEKKELRGLMPDQAADERFMRVALSLAARGRGRTSPNPMVGALVVRDAEVVGRGFHPKAGEPHAEVFALREAGERARGATLYVTLEPCSHVGRTPPCAPAVLQAGISEVFAAMEDPDPRVSGSGLRYLSEQGVRVHAGVLEAEARELNQAYIKRTTTGLPFVELKVAMTLDGKIATRSGRSRWITGEQARAWVHERRDGADVVLVGANTVRVDDPELTVRLPDHDGRHPLRAVVTVSGDLDPAARMFRGPLPGAVVFCPESSSTVHLRQEGVEVVKLPAKQDGLDLVEVLRWLQRRGANEVFVEGGGVLNAALLRAGVVDRMSIVVAPKLFGGDTAPGGFGDLCVDDPARAVRLEDLSVTPLGGDWLFQGRPVLPGEAA